MPSLLSKLLDLQRYVWKDDISDISCLLRYDHSLVRLEWDALNDNVDNDDSDIKEIFYFRIRSL